MADWAFPLAIATSGAIVGVSGVIATYRSGQRQTDVALETARIGVKKDLWLLFEQNRLARMTAAYTDLISFLLEMRGWVLRVHKGAPGDPSIPPLPTSASQWLTTAQVQMGWSTEVQSLYTVWVNALNGFHTAARVKARYQASEEDPMDVEGRTRAEIAATVETRREDVLSADRDLRERMFAELNDTPDLDIGNF